jgi:hypothetical protein
MLADVLEGIALVVRDEGGDVFKDDDLRSPQRTSNLGSDSVGME